MVANFCTLDVPNMNKYSTPEYAYVRSITMDELNNMRNIFNATFSDGKKYYNTANISNISEKDLIFQMYKNEKFFGEEEKKSLNLIISKLSVERKNNFFEYYD